MRKRIPALTLALALLVSLCPEAKAAPVDVCEAENARLLGGLTIVEDENASGGRAVGRFEQAEDEAVFSVAVAREGFYDLSFRVKGIGGQKYNIVCVDGTELGRIRCEGWDYMPCVLRNTRLTAGTHAVSLRPDWGWVYLDSLTLTEAEGISDGVYHVTSRLSNPHATRETAELYEDLCGYYGRCILSGQQCDEGIEGEEFRTIHAMTGRYPAIMGLDIMDYAPSRALFGARSQSVEHAVAFHERGGIVSFCWHWNAPPETIYPDEEGRETPRWWGGYRTENSSFDVGLALNGGDPAGKASLDRDIAAIAAALKRLEEAHVPVLWRPLHEGSGGWFWWGAQGPEVYKQLWVYLYGQLTGVYHCDNLIWVWSAQDPDWYPGDAFVDIIGEDIYARGRQYTGHVSSFTALTEYPGERKIIALTENSVLPDVDACAASNAWWGWFCTWSKDYIVRDGSYHDAYTGADMLRKVYGSDLVITLDELRGFPRSEAAGGQTLSER